ncbi:tripartite tricarboxylate transporter TctB family protein [Pontibaca salina]|uniref:Tripartite tricarboxylate transporter TctB family protein n=1 Tax=Pontibaca salina TaxID=2795731 RepID=A0A934HM46_9RHOB|nr:tripartite tricarboxylate transporter TctB family protein [Pontibaca salina]MBI6629446.1 tripartite tricarboxylate transporter TctB family protein [Pontibaca salina]
MWSGILRGVLISVLFGFVLFVLIPVHVPRPAFIPGFAPPPDMWPRTVSIAGIVLGLIVAVLAWAGPVARPAPNPEKQPAEPVGLPVLIGRFALVVLAFGLFIMLVPRIGFVLAAILLTAAAILLTGERQRLVWGTIVAVALPIVLALFFNSALGTQFPKGPFSALLGF